MAITPSVFGTGSTNGATRVEMEVSTSIAMKIVSPNDVNPDCITEAGVTYGVANRYASSTGDDSGKMVDTFDGREGGADEINTSTSCAKLNMTPNTFDSTYSDVTVFTNSPAGYALTVQPAENTSPDLVNVSDNTKTIPAGTLTESNNTVAGGQNKWAYKTNNGIVTDWTAMTASAATIKSYDSETSGGETTRVTYGISTGNNPTGTYTTELTYTATMFDAPITPACSSSMAEGQTCLYGDSKAEMIKLKDGGFWTKDSINADGWDNALINTCPSGTHLPSAQEFDTLVSYYGANRDSAYGDPYGYYGGSSALYEATGWTGFFWSSTENATDTSKVWRLRVTETYLTVYNDMPKIGQTGAVCRGTISESMQNFSAADHFSDTTGTIYTLKDSRDDQEYTAAKLADGNIWMTQDLKLDGGRTLTSADSDVTTNFNLLADNSGTWCTSQDAACFNQSLMTKQGAPNGYYYNWYAATAGTGTYSTGAGQNATASVCPKGWKLPTGGPSGQFAVLDIAYGGNGSNRSDDAVQAGKFMSAPINFNYTGYYSGGDTYGTSEYVEYWSRTADGNYGPYYMEIIPDYNYFLPQQYYHRSKYDGVAVCCIAAS